jgi:IPT/TIG domain
VIGTARAPNTVSNAATFGQTLALSGTGLGDARAPAVSVGGRPAKIVASHTSTDGDEILFQIPTNTPEGCFVPVQVHGAGRLPSNTVTVAIPTSTYSVHRGTGHGMQGR